MKVPFVGACVIGTIVFAVIALITAGVISLGLAIAYVLTLLVNNMEMRQAIIPGSVLAVSSLYFCVKFFTHTIDERNFARRCDECKEDGGDDHGVCADATKMTFVRKSTENKQARCKTT